MGQADQKVIPGRYQVFPRTLCFVTSDCDVLLLRGAPDKTIWPNLYNGVGGHVEADEDVYSAALREIEEETGLPVRNLRMCGIVNIPVAAQDTGVMLFVFTAEAGCRSYRESPEGSLEWVSRDRIDEVALVEDLPVLLPRVLSHSECAAPFFAHYSYDEDDRLRVTFGE